MGENDIVYQLCPGLDGTEAPVAAFSDNDTIDALVDKLGTFIEGGVSVKQVRAEENLLPVDKYAFLVEIGLVPYNISLHRDGHSFEPADLLGTNLDELTIEEHYEHVVAMRAAELADLDKMWGIGGVFWAPNAALAFKKAKLMRKILFTALDIPFKSEKAKRRKKYTLQEVTDLSTWFEYKLSTARSSQFIDNIDLTEQQVRDGLFLLLTSAREGGGESSANRDVFKDLRKIRNHFTDV